MADVRSHRQAVVERVLAGPGTASIQQRRAAFDNSGVSEPARVLIDKVARHAYKVADEDIAAARAGGLSEDEIFELTVCAALGVATRQHDAALAALTAALAPAMDRSS
jgi:alkylhydroperoxidase family enzyme